MAVSTDLRHAILGHRWVKSANAKQMQPEALCLVCNLLTLFEHALSQFGITNEAEQKHQQERRDEQEEHAQINGGILSSLVKAWKRSTQTSLKLIRWLRHFLCRTTFELFLPQHTTFLSKPLTKILDATQGIYL